MYSNALRVHIMQIGMNLSILAVGEVMLFTFDPFEGFGGDWADANALWLRLGAGLLAFLTLIRVPWYRSPQTIQRRIHRMQDRPWIDDPAGYSLQITQVLTSSLVGSIGVFGLLIFFLTGDRLDLYLFVVPTLGILGMYTPTRTRWESDRVRYASSAPSREDGM